MVWEYDDGIWWYNMVYLYMGIWIYYLVGGLEDLDDVPQYFLGMVQSDELHDFFRGVGIPPIRYTIL